MLIKCCLHEVIIMRLQLFQDSSTSVLAVFIISWLVRLVTLELEFSREVVPSTTQIN